MNRANQPDNISVALQHLLRKIYVYTHTHTLVNSVGTIPAIS
jgi:hypothetical protein